MQQDCSFIIEFSSLIAYNKNNTKITEGQSAKAMDIEKFTKIANEEACKMPQEFYNGLTGGIIVDEKEYVSENAIDNDLFVLGRYSTGLTGKWITLYYGSFMKIFSYLNEDQMREQINHTIRHEFRHHLENLAGIHGKDSLEEEDRKSYYDYIARHKKISD